MKMKQTDTLNDKVLLGTFYVGDVELAAEIAKQKEILRMAPVTRLPGESRIIEGAINHRGAVLPILELRRFFSLPPKQPDAFSRIIIMEVRGTDIGVVVDSVGAMHSVSEEEIVPTPSVMPTIGDIIQHVFTSSERTISLIDVDKLLPA